MALPVSRLIRAQYTISPLAAATRSFGILCVAGDSQVISGAERVRTYSSANDVATDFGSTAPEYLAAALYFGQTPKPATMMVGRWFRTASPANVIGGILSDAQKVIANWTSISSGGFSVTIDGVVKTLTGLDFTGVTNLNGVASVINTSLTGGSISYDGQKFTLKSATTGTGVNASGSITFIANPVDGDTVTVNGVAITFKASAPTGNQVLIGASANATAANLLVFLQTSVLSGLASATYAASLNILTITYGLVGVAGNAFTLAKTSTAITLSGATLTGGLVPSTVGYATAAGLTDISSMLKLTALLSIAAVSAFNAEQPIDCAIALANKSTAWYGLEFAASVQPTDDQFMSVAGAIQAMTPSRILGVTILDLNAKSSLVSSDLGSRLFAASLDRTVAQFSQTPHAVASFIGRAFSTNFKANRSVINLMYKQEPGVVAEDLSTAEADALKAKKINVFAKYVNDTLVLQYGTMSGQIYFDERHGLDWFLDLIQTSYYNLLYTSTTKIPQTDEGSDLFLNAAIGACKKAKDNGLVGPGIWTSDGFGTLKPGDQLDQGYYVYISPMAQQSSSDRAQRVLPPTQVALKLAGAVNEADILISVNR